MNIGMESHEALLSAIATQLQKLEDDTDLTSASDFRMYQNQELLNSY